MHLVAIASLSTPVDRELPLLAADLGVTPYEARLLLSAPPPSIVLTSAERSRAVELASRLRARGHDALYCDADAVVRRPAMVTMRRFELSGEGLIGGNGLNERLPFGEITALIRAQVRAMTETTTQVKDKQLAIGRALLSGGLVNSKTVTREVTTKVEEREQVLYVFRRGGLAPWLLEESRTHYGALGAELAPTTLENFQRTIRLLRAQAPEAPYDERLLKGARNAVAADTDLMAHLIALSAASAAGPYRSV